MTTKIIGSQITNYTVNTEQLSNTAVAAFAKSLSPKITTVNVANSAFSVLDDSAVNIGGGYIVVTGSEFQSGASVLIDTTAATAVTYINSTTLHVQVPSKSAASYNLYVVNPDGGTGIRVAGVTYSASPTWVTASPLANQLANVSFNVALSATGATTYSNTTSIPAGTTLLSNGYFYGTVTIGAETTYTFDVKAEDAELQDSTKTFQVTITLAPTYYYYSWGNNNNGQLGLNDTVTKSSPVQVGTAKWKALLSGPKIGTAFAMNGGIKDDGTLWLWGDNSYGKLGHNDTTNRSSPVQVGSATNWLKITTTYRGTTFAIKTDNTFWRWGAHTYGLVGSNVTYPGSISSPAQLGSQSTWSDVATGEHHVLATKTDGTLWMWGLNNHGQSGTNDYRARLSSPTQIGSLTNWSKVSSGGSSCFALNTSSELFAWGNGTSGKLGLNSTGNYSSPVKVGSSTNWTANVSVSGAATSAVKTDGTLWTWGQNGYGQLGLNASGGYANKSSPTQVGSDTTWKNVKIGPYHAIATKTNGTLWTWGDNYLGILGLNDGVRRSSPVQIGSETTWGLIEITHEYQSIATKST